MSQPLVSILTPSLNQAQWLPDNLESVRNQTYRPIEHIVMDGGSTDTTVDILRGTDDSVRWWSQSDRGQSHALNKAFERSKGDIIGWINSDDAYFSTNVVDEVVKVFQQGPDIDLIYGHAALVNESGLILWVLWTPAFSRRLLTHYNYILQPSVFIRRRAIASPLVREDFDFSMDRDLWLRLSRDHRFKRFDKIISVDRHQRERKTYQRSDLHEADRLQLIAEGKARGGVASKMVQQGFRFAIRLAGIRILLKVSGDEFAFPARSDGFLRTLNRQLTFRRRQAPMGAKAS